MRLADIVSFRKDLLFNGAVQLSWFEKDRVLAESAAEHFVFHGPNYHGVVEEDLASSSHKLLDTASFTLDILERINGIIVDEPFALAIAGYGTGKSHLAVTLAILLNSPTSHAARKILDNITMVDAAIGKRVHDIIAKSKQPFLVVSINGMQDFDLCGEIIRQVLFVLNQNGLDTTVLENLRPRFKSAINFTESFFDPLREDYEERFGKGCNVQEIIENLRRQDEETFRKVSDIYEQKMGSPIYAVGQESLNDFINITKENYCGPGKPFAGILIIFDEFGRYLEFAVQKPHIAGPGALQQLFECVQTNSDRVFLLCFIQYELKAYISRIAPELRDDLSRYVTRYDAVRKVRLSTNLETLIANLLEKKNVSELERQLADADTLSANLQSRMINWFPDIKNHAVWMDPEKFNQVICRGCWPLHPCSTWVLYKLTTIGKSLQQRSALSLLADIYTFFQDMQFDTGRTIRPVDLCSEAMISEFLASERYGQHGAAAHSYESVMQKYYYELSDIEKMVLKGVLVSSKIGIKVDSKEDYLDALAEFCGIENNELTKAVQSLEREYAVLTWNELLRQYEITGDAAPRREFVALLKEKVSDINSLRRANIFSQNYKKWSQFEMYPTDFGSENNITTREWNYKVYFTDITMLEGQIDYAIRTWRDAMGVDEEKGQLIYCYVGPESNIDTIKVIAQKMMKTSLEKNSLEWEAGAPIAVIFLYDNDGTFGQKIAEYWVLEEGLSDVECQKYANFIIDRKNGLFQEISNQFTVLERERHIVFATERQISAARLKRMLVQLFEVIYPKRIPFPFDGFHTTRGNAAKDCQVFTKELFLGNLDRDWISTCSEQQRNRAYQVLDRSWGIIDDDGSIRLKPSNKVIREIIELLESKIGEMSDSETPTSMNIGDAMRLLCAPPFGCNIASAGMILSLFVGRRKKEVNLLKNDQTISFEKWLSEAMPGNFFDLSILDQTYVIRVSKEKISEWENLLDEWSIEKTLSGKVDFRNKALELDKRVAVPQQLYYKYKHLYEQANDAVKQLNWYNSTIEQALNKVDKGVEKDEAGLLSWGAADLVDLYDKMQLEDEKWTKDQMEEVKKHLAYARLQTQQRFWRWLSHRTVSSIEQLGKFKHDMLIKIGENLSKLELFEEKRLLEAHVEKVEQQINLITDIKRTVSDIEVMLKNNIITSTTPFQVLVAWLEQVNNYEIRLEKAKKLKDINLNDVDEAAKKLENFRKDCQNQLQLYKERVLNVFNITEIKSLSDLAYWRSEIDSLIRIYEGREKDIEDLKLVQKQLELVELHYQRLSREDLDEEEFQEACKRYKEENDSEFLDDAPPLDNELIYGSFIKEIRAKREREAAEWMQHNIPDPKMITRMDAETLIQLRDRLQKMPRLLSTDQVKTVRDALATCEKRLDELKVEGLLAKFRELSEENKKMFLSKISDYISKFITMLQTNRVN
ncbi:hypothetical protein Tph_c16950 [Thermacetogenium phaeum DSM 12270]|uniref:Uncharacterized protein n=1 Tax=Thermacetogenium phaeum (strain ATCC BAA-254 / DSM 26808 / PB) TaxID=1089553 RepID=K4LGC3_THEPS|nr:hypothetical protein [Thermacetogenium phaeum]AFV11898.1 hypothetical protein Tph_c16950 [Thermacetogenium phaeum DSM 12270]